ncbi:hypothetical protein Voc01_057750 [Virgisporangium ochraceum]|uniref:Glycosyl hydrolase family 67 C-terminal domain-containing protein n=1 Tax=Virgisporangium ochraceum TaxID=65505 RepID=A0A8J4EDR5_9ACTN|nr:hypothetical protein Voc01_057750 [Virgisporangium ochraceum]
MLLLALGAGVAWGVGDTLALTSAPAAVPVERTAAAPVTPMVPAPAFAAVVVTGDRRVTLAAEAVADALVRRGLPRPAVVPAATVAPVLRVSLTPAVAGAEAYRVVDAADGLTVEASGPAGAAAGLYAVADRIRSGRAIERGSVVTPRLGLRLTDAGSVGREPDAAAFAAGTDYSLNTDIVGGALLPRAPWVDAAAVERIAADFRRFVEHALARGYNGVVVPGFLEYVTFRGVDGVYPAGDDHVARAEALAAAFAPVYRYAADLGMRVYMLTDMLAVSPPLERYLDPLDVTSPRLWSVYRAGLAELFDRMPFLSGLMVRIGEGGEVYAQGGWDYSSKLVVTTGDAVRAMLRAFLATAGEKDKDIIFRTWTVGVGAVGDLHTSPRSYESVLGGIDDPHLVVSTKYTNGDFYSHLPFNTTLGTGRHRRIVEFQARREFEAFGSLPNDLTDLHRQALLHALERNPHIEGVWTWTQDGGPLRAGPMTLYLRTGFWQLYDLNVYALGRLAWRPDSEPAAVTADWARQTFSDDDRTVAAVTEVMASSREAVTKGLYIAPYADRSVRALGLEPPPMMWIFEWDIVTGDSAALDSIYAISRGRVDEAVADGDRAVALATRMRETLAATDPAAWRDPVLRQRFQDTLTYQADLFTALGAYRTTVLRHAEWLDTGDARARDGWRAAERRYRAARASHLARYQGNLDFPAFNFTAADLGAARADRDPAMAWLARILLAAVVAVLAVGARRRPLWTRALWTAVSRPWRLAALPAPARRLDRVLVWLVPAAVLVAVRGVHTWFAAPAHLLVTLGAWLLFAVVVRLAVRRADPFHLWAAVGGVILLRAVIVLVALVARGPGRYWFNVWTDPAARFLYVTVAFAAFAWLFVVTALVLRDRYGLSRRRVAGTLLCAAGVPLAVLGGLVAAVGLERALTVWNDQLALLPWGLSRILGITVYLGIPSGLATWTATAGAVLVAAGVLLRPRRASA